MRDALFKVINFTLDATKKMCPASSLYKDNPKKKASNQLNTLFMSDDVRGTPEAKDYCRLHMVFSFFAAFLDLYIGISERLKLTVAHTLNSDLLHKVSWVLEWFPAPRLGSKF